MWRPRSPSSLTGPPANTRWGIAFAIYLTMWAAVLGSVIYGVVRAGYSLLTAIAIACALLAVLNDSMAYRAHVRQFRIEGKEPLGFFRFLFGLRQLKKEAPPSAHIFVGIAASLTGAFILYCGLALFISSDWGRISEPFIVVTFCVVVTGIGAALLYVSWRLLFGGSWR